MGYYVGYLGSEEGNEKTGCGQPAVVLVLLALFRLSLGNPPD